MKIHEYQAKQIMAAYAVPVPKGGMAQTAAEAKEVASRLGGSRFVVKAQVHAGGRGKGGGIKTADSPAQVETLAKAMLGSKLVTPQTGAEGKVVDKVLIEEAVDISREMYFGITVDRARECVVIIANYTGVMAVVP